MKPTPGFEPLKLDGRYERGSGKRGMLIPESEVVRADKLISMFDRYIQFIVGHEGTNYILYDAMGMFTREEQDIINSIKGPVDEDR